MKEHRVQALNVLAKRVWFRVTVTDVGVKLVNEKTGDKYWLMTEQLVDALDDAINEIADTPERSER